MPKLSKPNSVIVGDRIIYISKKNHKGKTTGMYIAFDYETKIQIAFHKDKDELINYLKSIDKDLKDVNWKTIKK